MWNSSKRDIFHKKGMVISIEDLSPELLHQLTHVPARDEVRIKQEEALRFAVSMLSEVEFQLLFFRMVQENSYKTLKRTMEFGSTKTALKRSRKLIEALRVYTTYALVYDLEDDLRLIGSELGSDARQVAWMLFCRKSRHSIFRSSDIRISHKRLLRTIKELRVLCAERVQLTGYYEVVTTVGFLKK